ncbi:MAG: hypothetical protein RLZZ135_718, partial [Cyanobacteriota bacterium]
MYPAISKPKFMNPDGNSNRQKNTPSSTPPLEIIDVRVVEENSSGADLPEDVWDSDEVADARTPLATQSSEPPQTSMPDSVQPETTVVNPESIEDNWGILLDEISQESDPEPEVTVKSVSSIDRVENPQLEPLLRAEAEIKAEIAQLQTTRLKLQKQIDDTQISFGQMFQTSIADLEQRRQKLQISLEQLERRRDRIKAEINKSFAGASQDVAIRLQGFKDYLVGSLQDLVVIAEEIEFPQPPPTQIRLQTPLKSPTTVVDTPKSQKISPQFAEPTFKATASKVRGSIERYRTAP